MQLYRIFFLQNMNREGVILFLIIVTSLLHANSDIWWNDIALLKKMYSNFQILAVMKSNKFPNNSFFFGVSI